MQWVYVIHIEASKVVLIPRHNLSKGSRHVTVSVNKLDATIQSAIFQFCYIMDM